ncbi:hypothetical protein [Granulicella sibirica]|uniref:Uncharacterized protein n=1 Tax=Granulicella sibirica TaxID=2479048 RepID=A0A4Q0T776_9BACT|nr:hypothetical protein [Granulicella sibirica]RXH57451.1 hypothetical protein GRAN_0761 [Granulicella sibirica]
MPAPTRPSVLHLWHLLSLDAPTVAVLWTCFTARLTHTPLPLATPVAMALAVWTLYAADRLLDTRQLSPQTTGLEPRHLFHHKHRTAFLIGIGVATIVLAALLPLLSPAAMRLYLTEAALMAGYFLLIHTSLDARPFNRPIPKELIVGPFFAAATFIPTISRNPTLRPTLLPAAILFAFLCSLNCLFIYAWEHPTGTRVHWTIHRATQCLPALATLLLVASILLTLHLRATPVRSYPIACALSTLTLVALNQCRHQLSRLTLRTAADAALLTPLLILPFTS